MPFFRKKFSPVKCPARKSLPFHTQKTLPSVSRDQIKLKLGDNELIFEQGNWRTVPGTASDVFKENEYLKQKLDELKEENNFLKLKIELLLDMLTEQTLLAENNKARNL